MSVVDANNDNVVSASFPETSNQNVTVIRFNFCFDARVLSDSLLDVETPSESRQGQIKGSSQTLDGVNPALAKQTRVSRHSSWHELVSPSTLQSRA